MHSANQSKVNYSFRGDTTMKRVRSGQEGLSGAMILNAISDDKSWFLFSTIAMSSDSDGQQSGNEGQISISSLNLTRRQYYQRINRLRSLGLINREKGRYSLSLFGSILYEIQKMLETAIQNRWRLVALDLLENSGSGKEMPVENRIKIINVLLTDNDQIKNILLNKIGSSCQVTKRVLH
ncbi:MAG: hypothetical protein ACRD8Z_23245 [Nitrososphaeraceae archaeon]